MIITNVCLLLEALSIVICLHHLYGEKFRLDIATVSFLSIDMIIMTAINYFGLPKTYTMVIYPVIILYCGVRFGFQWKDMILNIVFSVVFIGVNQIIVMLVFYYGWDMEKFVDISLLLANLFVMFSVVVLLPHIRWKSCIKFLRSKEKIILITFYACCGLILFWMISYKKVRILELDHAILLFVSIVFIFILASQLSRYKIKAKEVEVELKMHQLYSESFQSLIDDIRLKQHEFDNHINAMYSLHYSCHTFEELVESQKAYGGNITKNNRFGKLLSPDNAVISGFLYTKFSKIDEGGVDINYHVVLNGCDFGVPIYKIVEILGDLINNAVEALENDSERNGLYVEIIETDKLVIEVRNESQYISYEMLEGFFVKGYSKKGEGRGLGLYNIKQICDEYGLVIASKWMEINGKGWLSFKIWK